ncbi:hypothetical protein BGW38_010292, partial [Lunasporangiospora selenospora]
REFIENEIIAAQHATQANGKVKLLAKLQGYKRVPKSITSSTLRKLADKYSLRHDDTWRSVELRTLGAPGPSRIKKIAEHARNPEHEHKIPAN